PGRAQTPWVIGGRTERASERARDGGRALRPRQRFAARERTPDLPNAQAAPTPRCPIQAQRARAIAGPERAACAIGLLPRDNSRALSQIRRRAPTAAIASWPTARPQKLPAANIPD